MRLDENLENLVLKEIRPFEKKRTQENETYPTLSPIFLADARGIILSTIKVIDYFTYASQIRGVYKVLKIFNLSDRKLLTKLYREPFDEKFRKNSKPRKP